MASVQFKDAAAKKWCSSDATLSNMTGNKWIYVKIVQDVFEQYNLHSVMPLKKIEI